MLQIGLAAGVVFYAVWALVNYPFVAGPVLLVISVVGWRTGLLRRAWQGLAAAAAQRARRTVAPRASVRYLGGHPAIAPGGVQVWRDGGDIVIERGFARAELPQAQVQSLRWVPRSQVVVSGGGVSIGGTAVGAAVGTALLGPLGFVAGAVMGSRRRVQSRMVSDDVIVLEAKNEAGQPFEVFFAGGPSQHRALARALGVTL